MNKEGLHHILNDIVVFMESSGKFQDCEINERIQYSSYLQDQHKTKRFHTEESDNQEAKLFVIATNIKQSLGIHGTKKMT